MRRLCEAAVLLALFLMVCYDVMCFVCVGEWLSKHRGFLVSGSYTSLQYRTVGFMTDFKNMRPIAVGI